MKTTIIRVSVLFLFLSLLSCSKVNESEILEVSDKFFSLIDQKDYKAAYELLSKKDKEVMDADSFFIFFYQQEDPGTLEELQNIVSLADDFEKITTVIQPCAKDTFNVFQVQKIPDFKLIAKVIGEVDEPEEYFQSLERMKTQGSLPTRIDSSRAIQIVKEKGIFTVDIGLSEYSKYSSILEKIKEKELSKLHIKPISLIVNEYTADLISEIRNDNDHKIKMFCCAMHIDNTPIKDIVIFNAELEPKSTIKTSTFVLFDHDKLDSNENLKIISGSRINLILKWIIFASDYEMEKMKRAQEESGFDGFTFSKLTGIQYLLY